ALPALTGSGSLTMSISSLGSTCHDTPKWSVIQPQAMGVPPAATNLSQYSSTCCCVSQSTAMEKPWVNVNCGPPLRAVNARPSSVNSTVITLPVLKGDFGPRSG